MKVQLVLEYTRERNLRSKSCKSNSTQNTIVSGFDLSDTSAFQQNSKGKVWSRYATQASGDICFATFSELENQEIARWHFEKVQKAEEDVEEIVIQSPPWKEGQAIADQCFETLQECNKAEKSAFRLQCLHNMTHPMLTRWHWNFNIYPWESESVFLCLDMIYGWSVFKEVDISMCTWTGWELDIQYFLEIIRGQRE